MPLCFDWGCRTFQTASHVLEYLYEVLEHLVRLWMGIWLLTLTFTDTDASTDLWELGEILPDASVQTMPLCFDWVCRTFQTASHVRVIPKWGVLALSKLWMGNWPHIHIVTTTENFPDKWKLAEILPFANVQTMPLYLGWGWRAFQTISHVHGIPIWGVWGPSQVVDGYGFTITPLPPQMLPQICESWLKSYLMQVCKPCHYNLIEAVEPFKLHPMSLAYIHVVFEGLLRLWMGIWLHTHNATTTDTSPDLWELAEILPCASVQTMPLCFCWGCRTFQTASHVSINHIWDVWVPSQVVDGHMASHSHHYHHRCFPRFGDVGWNPTWCKCANYATTLWLRL